MYDTKKFWLRENFTYFFIGQKKICKKDEIWYKMFDTK